MKTSFRLLATAVTILCALCFSSCGKNIVYSQFSPISSGKWHVDSVARFDFPIADSTATYRMIVYVRHTERYPYQNMWIFAGDSLHRDTIEFYLADDRGHWLGEHHNGFIEMPVLLEAEKRFAHTGTGYMEIQHGMRDTLLRGVTDIGLEISLNPKR